MRSAAFSGMALLTLVALAACSKAAPESVAPLYDSAPVETRSIEVTVDAAGIVEPESLVEVKSKASGEVLAVHAEVGDVVEAGKLLVEIDKRTPRNAVSQTEAALAAAKARRTIAKTQLDRANQLYKSQTLTQIDVETNTVVKQWVGAGGDSVRFGHGSVWLSNLRAGNVWRIDPKQP